MNKTKCSLRNLWKRSSESRKSELSTNLCNFYCICTKQFRTFPNSSLYVLLLLLQLLHRVVLGRSKQQCECVVWALTENTHPHSLSFSPPARLLSAQNIPCFNRDAVRVSTKTMLSRRAADERAENKRDAEKRPPGREEEGIIDLLTGYGKTKVEKDEESWGIRRILRTISWIFSKVLTIGINWNWTSGNFRLICTEEFAEASSGKSRNFGRFF